MDLVVRCNEGPEIKVVWDKGQLRMNNREVTLDSLLVSEGRFHVLKNGKSFHVELGKENTNGEIEVLVNGTNYHIQVKNSLQILLEQLGMSESSKKAIDQIKAPMPGLILKILVEKGQIIQPADPILILEAMKMENIIKAGSGSIVREILVQTGQKVEKGQSLVIFE